MRSHPRQAGLQQTDRAMAHAPSVEETA